MTAPKKGARSRAIEPHAFDFNTSPQPAAIHAASAVTVADLHTLFESLDRADEKFAPSGTAQRAAALDALAAVVQFLAASPFNSNGRFSRPLELLYTELRDRPISRGARILPDTGGGAGGVDSRPSDDHVRAAAGFALEFLHKQTRIPLALAAGGVADMLAAHGFAFGDRRSDKGAAVIAWRRDYSRCANGKNTPALRGGAIFHGFRASAPFVTTGDAEADRDAALGWLAALVTRAGYGATA